MKRKIMMLGGGGFAAVLIAVAGYSAHSQSHQATSAPVANNSSWRSTWAPADSGSHAAGLKIQLDANGNHIVPPAAPGQTYQAQSGKATLPGNKTVHQVGAVKLVVPAKGSELLRPLKGADGKSELVHLHGKFHSAMKATIGPDGKLHYDCNEEPAQ